MCVILTAVDSQDDTAGIRYPTIIFTLHLRRESLYYVVNLIIPCFLLSLIAVSTFILQPSSSDRLGIGMYLFVWAQTYE